MFFALVSLEAHAKVVTITGEITCKDTSCNDLKLYIFGLPRMGEASPLPIEVIDNRFSAQVDAPGRFFSVMIITGGGMQHIVPYYNHDDSATIHMSMTLDQSSLNIQASDVDNQVLGAFRAKVNDSSRLLWTDGKDMSIEQIMSLLTDLNTTADSLGGTQGCSAEVRQYIKVWAYNTVHDLYENIPYIVEKSSEELSIDRSTLLPPAYTILDNEISQYFHNTSRVVFLSLGKGSLDDKFQTLYQSYNSPDLRLRAADMLLHEFISKFNYKVDYEKGLSRLEEIVSKYDLDKKYLEEFKKRKATVIGNPFPENVVLTDINGKRFDFNTFRGKYVYIDLWASWCGPCMKEIPHMKRLEKENTNKDIVFLSLSIDTDEKAWKNKVKSLDLKGHQVIDLKNELPKALNVSGIPFFVVYDKEGKLYEYNAPRPSDPNIKEFLESLH